MKVDFLLILLLLAAIGLVMLAPSIEGIDQKLPVTTSDWLYPTTTEKEQSRPRPFSTGTDCKKIAGYLSSTECPDPTGNNIV